LLGEAYELRIEDEFLELLAGTKDRTGHENRGDFSWELYGTMGFSAP
jgi:hypothetical protein